MIYVEDINNLKLAMNGILILLLFIFFFFLLLYTTINLYKKNKNLERKLEEKEEEIYAFKKKNQDQKEPDHNINDLESHKMPLDTIADKITDNHREKKELYENTNKEEKKPYQKNILKSIKAPTSPININNSFSIKESKMNLNDFIKKEHKTNDNTKILPSKEYENQSTNNYINEVSKRLEKASDNEPISLTNYEKMEEEEAIISYRQLLENKDKIYQITDDEADLEFISELKNFRESLNDKIRQ